MIHIVEGDIFKSKAQALVNPVNCVGIMGKGLALKFKNKFPDMFLEYKKHCQEDIIQIGKMFVYSIFHKNKDWYIINFPTKKHWRENSKIEYIEEGLKDLVKEIEKLKLTSIAIPALGCGLGGLEREDVSALIKKYLSDIQDVEILFYK